jgi:Trypsin-like peptidase domain
MKKLLQREAANVSQAIVRVGGGRGFIVEHRRRRLVITAAHCLPIDDDGYLKLRPALMAMDVKANTHQQLLGQLGAEPSVWCECLFVNPVADMAVLRSPDDQLLYKEATAYDTLVDVKPLVIADVPRGEATAYLLSLDGELCECTIMRHPDNVEVIDGTLVVAGMSGSPIISTDGKAIALVSTSGSYNPVLRDNLPAWFFRR